MRQMSRGQTDRDQEDRQTYRMCVLTVLYRIKLCSVYLSSGFIYLFIYFKKLACRWGSVSMVLSVVKQLCEWLTILALLCRKCPNVCTTLTD